MELTDILRCPKTGNRLRFDRGESVIHVQEADVTYPIVDGIIDFCPGEHDNVSASYDACASKYDAYITSGISAGVLMKCFNRLVWGFSDDQAMIDSFLSYLPSEFGGVLLDVPVGTGVFTASPYARFPNATIIGVDYSMGMLQEARKRFLEVGLNNVHLIRADVANLPVRDGAVNQVVSMAGLHAFPNKQRALAEMGRVLLEQGTLVASTYVSGTRWLTDLIIKFVHVRCGFFSPPFFRFDNIAGQLEGFRISRQENYKCCACFEAVKDHTAVSRTSD